MLKLGHLGPGGTFSHEAAEIWSKGQYELEALWSITGLTLRNNPVLLIRRVLLPCLSNGVKIAREHPKGVLHQAEAYSAFLQTYLF